LEHLTTLGALNRVEFSSTGALGESLAHLASLPALTELTLWDLPLADVGVQHIGQLKQLTRLSIAHSTLVDDQLKHLANLGQLEQLSLHENGISDEGIIHLAKLSSLKSINLSNTFVTAAAKANLVAGLAGGRRRRDMMHGVDSHRDPQEERPAVSPEYLATVREIIRLGAGVCPDRSGSRVWLFPNWSGGDEKLALLEKLGDVRGVFIKAPLTDAAVPYLTTLKQLEIIRLDASHITEAGVQKLRTALPSANIVLPHNQ
jgi:hypothetical protein